MKKVISVIIMIALCLSMFTGCANSKYVNIEKEIDGKKEVTRTYVRPYGAFESDEVLDGVEYSLSWGNVILAVIFCETLVVPLIIVGWYLFEPDGPKVK